MSAAYRGRIKIKRQPWQECPFDSGPSASRKDWRCFGRLNKRRTNQDLAEHFEAAGQAAAAIFQANALPSTPVKHVLHLIEGAETLFLARMQLPNPKYLSLQQAGHACAHRQWAQSYYQQRWEQGKGHHAAVRGVAFQRIRIVFRCWEDRDTYDESRYLAALAKRNSPLAAVAGGTIP
jgi:hypothetical protein